MSGHLGHSSRDAPIANINITLEMPTVADERLEFLQRDLWTLEVSDLELHAGKRLRPLRDCLVGIHPARHSFRRYSAACQCARRTRRPASTLHHNMRDATGSRVGLGGCLRLTPDWVFR
jgi:hypothetical protein